MRMFCSVSCVYLGEDSNQKFQRLRHGVNGSMRQSQKETTANQINNRLFNIDFHEFLENEAKLSDIELAQEMGITLQDIRTLREKMRR